MLATFVFELGAAVYILLRQKPGSRKRISVALLVALGIFQLAEFMLCQRYGLKGSSWSKIGYVAITTLPPLGLHLIYTINQTKPGKLVVTSYICMTALIISFLSVPGVFSSYECTGNYVIFDLHPVAITLFTAYYYLLLLMIVIIGAYWSFKAHTVKKTKINLEKSRQLNYVVVGCLAFMLPVTAIHSVNPSTAAGIPSIMCGFAVLLAFSIVYGFHADKSLYK